MTGWHHQLNGLEFEQTQGDNEGQGSLDTLWLQFHAFLKGIGMELLAQLDRGCCEQVAV